MSSVSKKDKSKRLDKQKGTIQLYERLNYLCRHNPYDFERVQKRLGQTLTPQEINEIIYWSVKKNRIHIIEFLVETYEVKLMPIDKTGQTAIHMAERKDFREAVEKLMLKTCLDENRCDSDGLSYLQIACLKGMYDIVKKFIDMGVDANLSLDHAMIKGIVDCSNKYHGKGKVQDLDGDIDPEIPEIKSIKIFELLLKCGADPNVDPDDGRNALHKLITMTYNSEPSPIIFHGSGGPYAGRYYIATRNIGKRVHYMSSGERHLKYMMKLLLENGVNVNAKDKYGFSALNIAVSLLQYDAVYLLVKNGADVQSVTFQELGYFNYESHYELNLDLIESLMAILELLESKGFVLTAEDHKGVLRFLMGTKMIKDRELTPNACVLLLKSNLLESHGSEDRYEFTLKLFLNTVRKFNIFLNKEKKNFLYKYLNSSPENLKSELLIFESKHEQEEFDLAKKTMISEKRSLYDLCVVNAKKRLLYLKNASYKEFLDEENFNYRLGDTGKIIKGLIVESYRRSLFERIVMKYFQVLTLKKLPDLCCECIIDFLSVDDLASVYEAVTNSKIKYSRALHW